MNISKLEYLPQKTGVYKFYNKDGVIIYIGKALNLRNRVLSYFNSSLNDRPYVKKMIPLISDIKVVETNNEIESLVLESTLIKKFKPKFNSDLKDDKSYVWIYISTKDTFPTVKIVRNINTEDMSKGKLFGPYPNSSSAKRVFTYLRKLYPFCTCSKTKLGKEKKCLYLHLGLCPGPYQGLISKEEYKENINEIIAFLKGKKRGHILELQKQMREYSINEEFEKAAKLRDKIEDLNYLGENIDFAINDTEESYTERRKKLLLKNFTQLKEELKIPKLSRIECYDISNIQGKEAYGSLVVAENGEIVRNKYRIFKIKSLDTPNDMHMLKEVIARRFDNRNASKYEKNPEVVLIDGGLVQLSVLEPFVPKEIKLLGITKGRKYKRKGGRLLDEFWEISRATGEVNKIKLSNKEILIDLRDEAHRFAIIHHRKARIKSGLQSEILHINGVGQKSKKKLLLKFKSINNLRKASFEDLNKVLNNRKISSEVFNHFRNNN